MNNKLFARIAAAAISFSMLSTVALAADPTPAIDEDGSLSFVVEGTDTSISDAAQITLMAYVVPDTTEVGTAAVPAYVDQTIVALDQVAGTEGFDVIPLDTTLLGDATKIAVKVGGTGIDTPFETVLALSDEEAPAVVLGDLTGDGTIDSQDAIVIYMADAWMDADILERYGWDMYSDEFVAVGDINGDTVVDSQDALIVYMYDAWMHAEIYERYGVIIGDMDPADYE